MSLFAQDCVFYYPKTKGAKLEYKSFDKKDKITGRSTQLVKDISENGGVIEALIETQSFDKKDKDLGKNEYTVKCENGVYSVDMKSFLDAATMEAYKDMNVNVTSDNLQIPSSIKVGDVLPDGKLRVMVSSEGVQVLDMSTTLSNRKVETREQITTEAGTFDCVKITYTITTKMMISVRFEVAEWFCEGVGSVKTESYSKGNLMSYTVLSAITK
ncbi:MAG: hypothetical protein A2X13_11940 [Bacteroidetes bacterium GWC2_33_15]|nr:MAG: hypothetical protein A2X10_05965 [Bacteroidetes bacterium GWA2_33_15]OFX50846.1 MAG: hypothetical protein A2X13_11940 [Bacteroidetes bacterium GWC2_33_15]OFX62871.1 MAG: hypothetical protein A2X15_09430 [Bacteroidetes bacterium GWB2_32_14]OFX69941.1 MAG: hypothetical protein A2X14_02290 [Bacteroidetes bacterium GWD2_33_33]HAN18933.1 hypothetical protein [Bacteroidales bacterium]